MGKPAKYDFEGYVTKYNVKCSDGVTIRNGAFDDCCGKEVPMVWHHLHDDPELVLGNMYLEKRDDGVYGYGTFNSTAKGQVSKELVNHGDIKCMSIHANNLSKQGRDVLHGKIREVSLVMAGANPQATIESISISHSDGSFSEVEDEFILKMGTQDCGMKTFEEPEDSVTHQDLPTVQEVFESLTDAQKNLLAMVFEAASSGSISQEDKGSDEGGDEVLKHNAFEGDKKVVLNGVVQGGEMTQSAIQVRPRLTKEEETVIFQDAMKCGSFKEAVLSHADEIKEKYGIENIEILFPDARAINNVPEWIKRKTEWVSGVINGARHSPFSRIKSLAADITADEARAKGYLKGNRKKEEVFSVMKRVTLPTTVYKKQKLDRDDIIDITSFDVVAWIRGEMRMMLEEELARAILIGDGRDFDDEDKIDETCIRPIAKEDPLYAIHYSTTKTAPADIIDEVVRSQEEYEGSGRPTMYVAPGLVTDMLLIKDENKRRIYTTETELASAMRVSNIVEVPVMKDFKVTEEVESRGRASTTVTKEILAILVNMNDYVIGADRGGEINSFDDFDIDYNQYKYLLETRCSGCLHKLKTAVVIERTVTTPVTPPSPGGT